MTISKTKSSFYRRLYVAYLIDSGIASVPEIMAATGMPRRTAQDTIAALEELDIVCEFEQREGARNHQGGYVIRDWGRYGGSGWQNSMNGSPLPWSILPAATWLAGEGEACPVKPSLAYPMENKEKGDLVWTHRNCWTHCERSSARDTR